MAEIYLWVDTYMLMGKNGPTKACWHGVQLYYWLSSGSQSTRYSQVTYAQ